MQKVRDKKDSEEQENGCLVEEREEEEWSGKQEG